MILSIRRIFSGNYRFNRTISSPQVSMVGQACFKPVSATTALYKEEGSYPLGGAEQTFYQNQSFVLMEDKLLILKGNGELLHDFDLPKEIKDPLRLAHTHLCKDDQYQLDLCLWSQDAFSTDYKVFGPQKNYSIRTDFQRASDSEAKVTHSPLSPFQGS